MSKSSRPRPGSRIPINRCKTTGKIKYQFRRQAQRFASRTKRHDEFSDKPGKFHAYRCKDCGFYHIGHQRPKVEAA